MMSKLKLFILLVSILILTLAGTSVLASSCNTIEDEGQVQNCSDCGWQECICTGEEPDISCSWGACHEASQPSCPDIGRKEYRCQTNAQNEHECKTQKLKRWATGHRDWESCTCVGDGKTRHWECTNCHITDCSYTDSQIFSECESWQKCVSGWKQWPECPTGQKNWKQSNPPSCQCEGECLEAPENPRYYKNPAYPTNPDNPESGQDSEDVKLPVKLDWDDVDGANSYWPRSWKISPTNSSGDWRAWDKNSPGIQVYLDSDNFIQGEESIKFIPSGLPAVLAFKAYENNEEHPVDLSKYVGVSFYIRIGENDTGGVAQGDIRLVMSKFESSPFSMISGISDSYDLPALEGEEEWNHVFLKFKENTEKRDLVKSWGFYVEDGVSDNTNIWIDDIRFYPHREEINPANASTNSELLPDSCRFKSRTTYRWEVIPCCSAEGIECKKWDQVNLQEFNTNPSPVPISPLDPDGEEDSQRAEEVSLPVTLDWCEEDRANSYRLKVYLIQGGEEQCHPSLEQNGGCGYLEITKESSWPYNKLVSGWTDYEGDIFISDNNYKWQAASCFEGLKGEWCSEYSPKWELQTASHTVSFELLSPPDGEIVSLPLTLRWTDPPGINSFNFEVNGITGTRTSPYVTLDHPDLSLNTEYNWRVQPCSGYSGDQCQAWSSWRTFQTTGSPPTLISPSLGEEEVLIPVKFNWSDIEGAGSYNIQIEDSSGNVVTKETTRSPEASVSYPQLKSETTYKWKVKTCAHQDGACGNWSNSHNFTTIALTAPSNLKPEDNSTIGKPPIDFEWDPVLGANFYQHRVIYSTTDKEVISDITSSPSVSHSSREFPETGDYQWQVRACLDQNCQEASEWGNKISFSLKLEAPPSSQGGLVPCGRMYDDPSTPWDEHQLCEPKHLFILIRNVLDFLFWKVGIAVMIFLAAISGLIFFFSLGRPQTIVSFRSLVRTAAIGLLILFLAWSVVSLILAILGYPIGLYGRWWKIEF